MEILEKSNIHYFKTIEEAADYAAMLHADNYRIDRVTDGGEVMYKLTIILKGVSE